MLVHNSQPSYQVQPQFQPQFPSYNSTLNQLILARPLQMQSYCWSWELIHLQSKVMQMYMLKVNQVIAKQEREKQENMQEKKKEMERQRYIEEGTNSLRHLVTQFKKRTGTNSVKDK